MPEAYSSKQLNIKTLQHLSHRLGFPIDVLDSAALKAEKSYKFEQKPKKSGKGFREISKPNRLLKSIQQTIHKLLKEVSVSEHAHCGILKKSNLTNAQNHCNKKWVFSLDFKNFFPSISHNRVYGLFFKELGCSPIVSKMLTRLCTVRKGVPQGSSMSMDIANLVCRKLDDRLSGLCSRYKMAYTRHCDDLAFSGESISKDFTTTVKKIISECGFPLNSDKETTTPHHEPQSVVGLRVNRKKPLLPRAKKREWRQEKYIFEKYEIKNMDQNTIEIKKNRLHGQMAYANYINLAQ